MYRSGDALVMVR